MEHVLWGSGGHPAKSNSVVKPRKQISVNEAILLAARGGHQCPSLGHFRENQTRARHPFKNRTFRANAGAAKTKRAGSAAIAKNWTLTVCMGRGHATP